MIGSQATRGVHVLAKFAPQRERCGVWSDGGRLRVIEVYPTQAFKHSQRLQALDAEHLRPQAEHDDLDDDRGDARRCALLAWMFANEPESLAPPPADTPAEEGWIWLPKDALNHARCSHPAGRDA